MVKILLLLLLGISLVAIGIRNVFNKTNSANYKRKLKKDPAFASKIAANLTDIYGKISIASTPDLFNKLISIQENTRID